MVAFLLWINIFSFTVFLIAHIPVWIDYVRNNRKSLDKMYLILMVVFGFWLVVFSLIFFADVFLTPLSTSLRSVLGVLRAIITLAFILFFSCYALQKPFFVLPFSVKLLVSGVMLVYGIGVVIILVTQSLLISTIVSVIVFSVLAAMAATGLFIRVTYCKNQIRKLDIPYLVLSLFYFIAAAVFSLLTDKLTAEAVLAGIVLPRALYSMIWGVLELGSFVYGEYQKERKGRAAIPNEVIRRYKLTSREQEVISILLLGLSGKAAAERLFISTKTLESHISSIYRKCDVKNRVELMNIIRPTS
jgi:DNA-binding CsgD family transcriptional regulator